MDKSMIERNPPSTEEMRSKILNLEAAIRSVSGHMTQADFDTRHHFSDKIYMRELHIPRGVRLVGKIHKTEHMCILSKGDVSVLTDDGAKRIQASTVIHSMTGMKRVLHAHEDSIWINCHHNPTNETDLDKIDRLFVADTFEEFYLESKRSFDDVIKALGTTRDQMWDISANTSDQLEYRVETDGISIGPSIIHGKGVFALNRFEAGEVITPARVIGKRTPAGRYCNHGSDPNAKMVMDASGNVDLVALKSVDPGTEILTDYYLNFINTRSSLEKRS